MSRIVQAAPARANRVPCPQATAIIGAMPAAPLANRYYALRHGQSEANVLGVIASLPARAREGFGLTPAGGLQVEAAVRALPDLDAAALIVSSDYARAAQSAAIAARVLAARAPVRFDARLRERGFGGLEGASDAHYAAIWARDAVDPAHTHWGVESAQAVAARALALVRALDGEHRGRTILLVSHGDVLQILRAVLAGAGPAAHRRGTPIGTGSVIALADRA
ncbi:MAG: histidine phosphatase family protein [Gammaproteobacteria bacterium]